jgi:hypothetical protein
MTVPEEARGDDYEFRVRFALRFGGPGANQNSAWILLHGCRWMPVCSVSSSCYRDGILLSWRPMKTEPANAAAAESGTLPEERKAPRVLRRLLKVSFLVILPLILIPMLMPRKVSAKKLSGSEGPEGPTAREALVARETQIQDLVNKLKIRMSIPDTVVASIVEQNQLVVSVERAKDGAGGFSLSIQRDFLDGLTTDEIDAIIAHELGHVWIFTHHPFLQTEELANQIAMQVVPQDTLAAVYEKVWKRVGRKGNLVYLPPAAETSSVRQSQ